MLVILIPIGTYCTYSKYCKIPKLGPPKDLNLNIGTISKYSISISFPWGPFETLGLCILANLANLDLHIGTSRRPRN
jgi:hypothetical protein